MVAHLYRTEQITSKEKDHIKQEALREDSGVFFTLEKFMKTHNVNLWKEFCERPEDISNSSSPFRESSVPIPQFPDDTSVVTKVLVC